MGVKELLGVPEVGVPGERVAESPMNGVQGKGAPENSRDGVQCGGVAGGPGMGVPGVRNSG